MASYRDGFLFDDCLGSVSMLTVLTRYFVNAPISAADNNKNINQ